MILLVKLKDGRTVIADPGLPAMTLALGTVEWNGLEAFAEREARDGVTFTGNDVDALHVISEDADGGSQHRVYIGFEVVTCEHGFSKLACPECK